MVRSDVSTGFESCTVDEMKRLARVAVEFPWNAAARPVLAGFGAMPASHREIPMRRADVLALLIGLLTTVETAQRLYASLGDLDQAAVREAVHDPEGSFDERKFVAKYGGAPSLGVRQLLYRRSHGETPVLRLFLPNGASIPTAAREALAEWVPKPRGLEPETTEAPPEAAADDSEEPAPPTVVAATEEAALHDVQAVLRLVEAGRVRVGSTGRVSEAGAKAVLEVLTAGDYYPPDVDTVESIADFDARVGALGIRPFAWVLLLQAGNLAKAVRGRLELTQAGRAALSSPAHVVLRDLWTAWLGSELLHELNRVELVKGQKSASQPLANPSSGRKAIATALAGLPQGRWAAFTAFHRFLVARGLSLDVVENPWDLFIEDREHGSFGCDDGPDVLDACFARAFLLEYAATLGVIDVALTTPWNGPREFADLWGTDDLSALTRYDGLLGVRVTPLGAWILGARAEYTIAPAAPTTPFRVLPTRDICALGPDLPPADALFLDRVAERTSDRVWRLSRAKLLAAFETGTELSVVRAFLHARSEGPLPATVVDFLDGIEARTTAVRDGGTVRVVECRDAALALELANDGALRELCIHGGENRILVPRARESAFRRALQRAGYVLPASPEA